MPTAFMKEVGGTNHHHAHSSVDHPQGHSDVRADSAALGENTISAFSEGASSELASLGLSHCSSKDTPLILAAEEELVVLVHGCNSSKAKFTTLAKVFAHHQQRAICFSYDDRDSLVSVAKELRRALHALQNTQRITLVGHSQGVIASMS